MLLAARLERQKAFDAGERPDFRPDTLAIRDGDWRIGAIPADLHDRRVEITGPLNAAVKSVNDLFRPPLTLWKKIEEALKKPRRDAPLIDRFY